MFDDSLPTAADSRSHRPALETLARRLFPALAELGEFEAVAPEVLPLEYQILLAHHDHMTVAIEAFHETLVNVQVLAESNQENLYTRSSLLSRRDTGALLQWGMVSIDLGSLPPVVREQIVSHAAPLGRVLIRNNVLREVELKALWRVTPGPQLQTQLQLPVGQTTYGRSARITVNNHPAVEVLEIVRLV